jgi:hypothetical protein
MSTNDNIRGYTPALRDKKATLDAVAKLRAAGCGQVYVDGDDGDTLEEAIRSLRKGDRFVVEYGWHLATLPPAKRGEAKMPTKVNRATLRQSVAEIDAKGATIFELATGRDGSTHDVKCAILWDAVEALTSGARGRAGATNGKLSRGRPVTSYTPEQYAVIERHWYNTVLIATNHEAAILINRDPQFQKPIYKGKRLSVNMIWRAMREKNGKDKAASGRPRHKPEVAKIEIE